MINAGKSFCPYCVEIHDKAFYGGPNLSWGVWLNRNKLNGKYEVKAEDFKRNTAPRGKITLANAKSQGDGLPKDIQLEYTEGGKGEEVTKEERMYRCCPVCARKKEKFRKVNWVLGRYPTFVIAMIGDRSAGKSAWLDSIATAGNTNAVNDENYVHKLAYATPAVPEKPSEATDLASRGQSKVLLIRDTQDSDRVVAAVYLVDVAGELYNAALENEKIENSKNPGQKKDRSKKDLIWDLLGHNHEYEGADGYIFVAPAVSKHDKAEDEYPADKIFQDLYGEGLLNGKPLAYVMTHADKLVESGAFRTLRSQGDNAEYPNMTADTFDLDRRTSYARADLLSRVALEHAVVRAYEPAALNRMDGPTKCFLVRSCEARETGRTDPKTGKPILNEDFRESRHVMDPLIWMLNQLKLFPLRERAD